jgi:hypothetical protein
MLEGPKHPVVPLMWEEETAAQCLWLSWCRGEVSETDDTFLEPLED